MTLVLPDIPPPRVRRSDGGTGWYSPRLNVGVVSSTTEPVMDHEFNHFQFQYSNTHGYLSTTLHRTAEELVIAYCRERLAKTGGGPITAPIYPAVRRAIRESGEDAVSAAARECIVPWSHLSHLERIFDGGGEASLGEVGCDTAVAILHAFEERMAEPPPNGARLRPFPAVLADASLKACPRFRHGPTEFCVGASHLLEAVASIVESTNQELLDGATGALTSASLYWSLWAWFVSEMVGRGVIIETGAPFTEAHLLRLRHTFLAIAQLALFVPCGRHFGSLRSRWTTWADVHPGYRFLNIVSEMERFGFIDDVQTGTLPLSDVICRHFGWPRIAEFFDASESLQAARPYDEAIKLSFAHQKVVQRALVNESENEQRLMAFLQECGPVFFSQGTLPAVHWFRDEGPLNRAVQTAIVSEWCWIVCMVGPPTRDSVLNFGVDLSKVYNDAQVTADSLYGRLVRDNPFMDARHYRQA